MIPSWDKKYIELSITAKCNMACHNCDAMIRQAPKMDNTMTVEQITSFINESLENNIKWEIIVLTGGEPLLHPNIQQIIRMLNKAFFKKGVIYKGKYNHTTYFHEHIENYIKEGLVILTNGKQKNKLINLQHTSHLINLLSTHKKDNNQLFYPINIAPIDNTNYKANKNKEYARVHKKCQCAQPCLTKHGYYPCTTGAAIDKVFGMDTGIKNIKDINDDTVYKQFEDLCKYCGYFNEIAPFEVPEEHVKYTNKTALSPTWKKKLIEYKIKKPDLTDYK
tara:strand:+ start:7784 stop:8617 length:834 start_codon:yes stop_codon:yes gene_type:complete